MNYSRWKNWVKQLPLSLKWFVVLILLRPIIDVFYFLKDISPLLSPLYIAGVATPILIGLSFLSRNFPRKHPSLVADSNFGIWAALVLFNLLLLGFIESGFDLVANLLRYTAPILLYFYLRRFVKSRKDLHGLLQTFLYSAIIPAGLLIYELTFSPINPEYLSEGRGGAARLQGGYADIMNYAIYSLGALLISLYFFLVRARVSANNYKHKLQLLAIITLSFAGLLAIKQSSSWGVAISIAILFLIFNMNSLKGAILVIALVPLFLFGGQYVFKKKIEPLIEKEFEVLAGEQEVDRSFNGRMARWNRYFNIWSDMPLSSMLFGVTLSGEEESSVMISGGMHSDYVRVLFLSGIFGLLFYLTFWLQVVRSVRHLKFPEKFLVIGSVAMIALLSVSTNPLLYLPLLYFVLPVFSFALLPKPIHQLTHA